MWVCVTEFVENELTAMLTILFGSASEIARVVTQRPCVVNSLRPLATDNGMQTSKV